MHIELNSVGCVYDTETKKVLVKNVGLGEHLDNLGEDFVNKLTDEEITLITENL